MLEDGINMDGHPLVGNGCDGPNVLIQWRYDYYDYYKSQTFYLDLLPFIHSCVKMFEALKQKHKS